MPIELGFILQRWGAMAEEDASLREKQPWKAAYEKDYAWLGGAIDKHYAGDDSDVHVLLGGVLQAFAGQTVDEYAVAAESFLRDAPHPTLGRRLRNCGVRAHGRAAALPRGTRLHMLHRLGRQPRLHAGDHPRDLRNPARAGCRQLQRVAVRRRRARGLARVRRRARRLRRRPGEARAHLEQDRPAADPGRRQLERRHPDAPLRRRQGDGRALRLLVLHDDAEREFDYTKGAEQALQRAEAEEWTVVSVKNRLGDGFSTDL